MGISVKKNKVALAILIVCLVVPLIVSQFSLPVQAAENVKDITTSTSDGTLTNFGTNYLNTRRASSGYAYDDLMIAYVGQDYAAGDYTVMRQALYFDTSSIPDDATLLNATLFFYCVDNSTIGSGEWNITIRTGDPSIYPHDPLEAGDYDYTKYTGDGGQMNSSLVWETAWNNITLNSQGEGWVDFEGYTKLVLYSSKDISETAPTGEEYLIIRDCDWGESQAAYLQIGYQFEGLVYKLYGAYDEEGYRDGAINCTLYKSTESPETIEVDGSETWTVENTPLSFFFDLGNNESRTIYIRPDIGSEEFYVFKPSEPFYTYYFTVADFLGVEWGFLESLINVNGTDRIVERWDIKLFGDLPFTMSWGVTYKMRLVCNLGTYYYPDFVAGATTEWTYPVTSDLFPSADTSTGDITVTGARMNASHIQGTYVDADTLTVWINMSVYVSGGSSPVTSTNVTASSLTYNWYDAESDENYYLRVLAYHETRGEMEWGFGCPAPSQGDNPFDMMDDLLGTRTPIPVANIVGISLCILVVGAFSNYNAGIGLVVGVLLAAVLTALGLMSADWTWLIGSMGVAIIIAFSMYKDRERTVV